MKIRKSLVAVCFVLATLGMSGVGEAQHVRSTTYRPAYRGHVHYGYHGGYRGWYGGVRVGWGVGWGWGWGGYASYPYYGWGVSYRHYPVTPRFVHYPARCPAPCLPQPVNVDLSPSPIHFAP